MKTDQEFEASLQDFRKAVSDCKGLLNEIVARLQGNESSVSYSTPGYSYDMASPAFGFGLNYHSGLDRLGTSFSTSSSNLLFNQESDVAIKRTDGEIPVGVKKNEVGKEANIHIMPQIFQEELQVKDNEMVKDEDDLKMSIQEMDLQFNYEDFQENNQEGVKEVVVLHDDCQAFEVNMIKDEDIQEKDYARDEVVVHKAFDLEEVEKERGIFISSVRNADVIIMDDEFQEEGVHPLNFEEGTNERSWEACVKTFAPKDYWALVNVERNGMVCEHSVYFFMPEKENKPLNAPSLLQDEDIHNSSHLPPVGQKMESIHGDRAAIFGTRTSSYEYQEVYKILNKITFIIWSWNYKDERKKEEPMHPGMWNMAWWIAWV